MTTARAACLGRNLDRVALPAFRAPRIPAFVLLALLLALLLGAVACQPNTQLGSDCDRELSSCSLGEPVAPITEVDLLFVVDNSESMAEEQLALASALPALLVPLDSGDLDGDGFPIPELEPPRSVHLGLISTDMGLPEAVQLPEDEGRCLWPGGDGLLQNGQGASDPTQCSARPVKFVAHTTAAEDPVGTAFEFGCMLQLGTGGCSVGQPLEAALKALWPSSDESVAFFRNTRGNGDATQNNGFLREESLLVVIVLTDGEDCSAWDGSMPPEDPDLSVSGVTGQPVDQLCRNEGFELHWIDRYVTYLRKELRRGLERRVIFAVVAGVPPDLVGEDSGFPENVLGNWRFESTELQDYYNTVLGHESMQQRVVQEGEEIYGVPGEDFMPACTVSNHLFDSADPNSKRFITKAAPARRLVEAAQGFGSNGVVQSICERDLASAMRRIRIAITNRIYESTL